MTKSDFLSFKQVVSLVKAIGHKRTILIMGENGIGKTSVHKALCADPDFADFIKPSPIDCTQLSDGSLFMPDIDRERGVSASYPTSDWASASTISVASMVPSQPSSRSTRSPRCRSMSRT
jgi:septin family protein